MHWINKEKEPECFSWQALTDEDKAIIIQNLKDEFKQRVQDNGDIEKCLEGMHWRTLRNDDELIQHYTFHYSLSILRAMIRMLPKTKKSATIKKAKPKAKRGSK